MLIPCKRDNTHMALNIPQQNSFFYKRHWSPVADALLVQTINRKKKELDWPSEDIPEHVVQEAATAIKLELGYNFTTNDINERLVFLHSRYICFKEVANTAGARWEIESNIVDAVDDVWKKVMKKNKLAAAYYHIGEPIFNDLAFLFGANDVKVEKEATVIVISDTNDSNNAVAPVISPAHCFSEEVTSPVFHDKQKLRRKLFTDSNYDDDRMSSNDKANHVYVPGLGGHFEKKSAQETSFKYPKQPRTPNASPCGSSCASSSPTTWRKNPNM